MPEAPPVTNPTLPSNLRVTLIGVLIAATLL
jgi:hypothetical protein